MKWNILLNTRQKVYFSSIGNQIRLHMSTPCICQRALSDRLAASQLLILAFEFDSRRGLNNPSDM